MAITAEPYQRGFAYDRRKLGLFSWDHLPEEESIRSEQFSLQPERGGGSGSDRFGLGQILRSLLVQDG